jgi:hypothetical protein
MPELTIGRMAKLYGMHRSSLYEAIDKGRVTAGFNGKGQRVIDLSEMIRVYGEPPRKLEGSRQNPTLPTDIDPTAQTDVLHPLLEELRALREEVKELRQALLLLPAPKQADMPEEQPEKPLEAEKSLPDDDPHGFRGLVKAMRDAERNDK